MLLVFTFDGWLQQDRYSRTSPYIWLPMMNAYIEIYSKPFHPLSVAMCNF